MNVDTGMLNIDALSAEIASQKDSNHKVNIITKFIRRLEATDTPSEKILTYVNKALELQPENIFLLWKKFHLLKRISNYEEAENILKSIEKLSAPSPTIITEKVDLFKKRGEIEKAFEILIKGSRDFPLNIEIQLEALAASREAGDYNAEAEISQRLASMSNGEEKIHYSLLEAEIYCYKAGDIKRACTLVDDLIKEFPENRLVLSSASEIYEKAGEIEKASLCLDKLISSETDTKVRTSLLWRKLAATTGVVNKEKNSTEVLKKILQDAPHNVTALKLLTANLEAQEQWSELEYYLNELAEIFENSGSQDEYTAVMSKLAELYTGPLEDPAKAFECYEIIHSKDPLNRTALSFLGREYATRKQWEKVISLYEKEVEITEDPKQKAVLYYKAALILEKHIKDKEKALKYYEAGAKHDCSFVPLTRALGRLYNEQGMWKELASLIEKEIEVSSGRERLLYLFSRLGRLYEEKLSDNEKAALYYEKALLLDPRSAELIASLGRIYHSRKEWNMLKKLYLAESDVYSDPSTRASILYQAAVLCRDKLKEENEAENLFKKALSIKADHLPSLMELSKIYAQAERWDEYLELVLKEIEVSSDASKVSALHIRAGEIYDKYLKNPDKAAEHYREAVRLCPTDKGILSKLASIYRKSEKWHELVEILMMLKGDKDLSALLEAAEILDEKLAHHELAYENIEDILKIHPDNTAALRRGAKIYRREGDTAKLADVFLRESNTLGNTDVGKAAVRTYILMSGKSDIPLSESSLLYDCTASVRKDSIATFEALTGAKTPAFRSAALKRAISFYLESGDLKKALEHSTSAIEIFPEEYWFTAKSGEIFLLNKEYSAACDMFQRASDKTDDDDEKKILLGKAAYSSFKNGDRKRASEILYRIIKADPSDPWVMEWLASLLEESGDYSKLASLLDQYARVLNDFKNVFRIRTKAAEILYEKLGDTNSAVEQLERLVERFPEERNGREALAGLLERAGLTKKLASFLLDSAHLEKDSDEKKRLLVKAAEIEWKKLSDPTKAVEICKQILAEDPSYTPAHIILQNIAREGGNWEDLAAALRSEKNVCTDPLRAAEISKELGTVLLEKIGSPADAVKELLEARTVLTDDTDILIKLKDAYKSLEKFDDSLSCAMELIAIYENKGDSRALIADLCEETAGLQIKCSRPLSEVTSVLNKGLAASEDHSGLLQMKASVCIMMHDFKGAAEVTNKLVELAGEKSPSEAVPYLMQAGFLYADKLNNPDEAVRAYLHVLRIDPDNIKARKALAEIYLKDPAKEETAVDHLRICIKNDPMSVEEYLKLASVFERKKQFDALFCTLSVLNILNALPQDKALLFSELSKDAPARPLGSIDMGGIKRCFKDLIPAFEIALLLLEAFDAAAPKIFKNTSDDTKPSKRDRVESTKHNEIYSNVKEAAEFTNCGSFDVYFYDNMSLPAKWGDIRGEPLLIKRMNPREIKNSTLKFLCAKLCVLRVLKAWRFSLLSDSDAEKLISAFKAYFEAETEEISAKDLPEEAVLVKKSVPRRIRKSLLQKRGNVLSFLNETGAFKFRKALNFASNRAAMLCIGSIEKSVKSILSLEGQSLSDQNLSVLAGGSEGCKDLLYFNITEENLALRRALGLDVSS